MRRLLVRVLAAAVLCGLSAGRLLAASEGQADLDRATETKLNAHTFSDLGEVIRLCESALKKGLDADNAPLAKNLLASALAERAKKIMARIAEGTPGDPNLPDFRQSALDDLRKATAIAPRQPEVLYLLAQVTLLGGREVKSVLPWLDDAIRYSAGDPLLQAQALTLRAELQKDADKKLADLSEAVRLVPGSAEILRARAAAYKEGGKLQQAETDYQAAIALAPNHGPTYEELALVQARLKHYDQAIKNIQHARKLAPKSISPVLKQAQIHAMEENYRAALADLNDALAQDPDNPRVLLTRAALYEVMEQFPKALADVDKVLAQYPGLPPAMRLRTVLLAGVGKFDQAAGQLEELLKHSPDDIEARLELALFYSAQHKPQKALAAYSEVLAKHPDHFAALRARGDTCLTTGKHAEAIADYEKAVKLQPKDPGVLNNLAWVLATSPNDKLRDGKRAIALATLACKETNYQQAHILSTLAAAYAETGDFRSATEWSEKAVQRGKDDQKAALAKELASYKAGKPWRELVLAPEPLKVSQFRPNHPTEATPAPSPAHGAPAPGASKDKTADPKK
jgi:tetratricopeptide (TPR) repeat protein